MELSSWYTILGVAIIVIAVIERFVIYKVLVGSNRWLPEKASRLANLSSGITLLAGVAILIGNAVLSKH